MKRPHAREAAREILKIIPLVMRTVAAELRAAGELPAPAHFGLLTMLSAQPRTLTELAVLQGVSLPTMSNSISAMVQRGWVRRMAPAKDRRVVIIEVTPAGKAAVERVGRAAEGHLAVLLAPLDMASRRRLQGGLAVLRRVFSDASCASSPRARRGPRAVKSRTST
jgi:DNA-binding MarR family transcriptional regulator